MMYQVAMPAQFDHVEHRNDALLRCIGLSSNFDDGETQVMATLCMHKEIGKSNSFSRISIRTPNTNTTPSAPCLCYCKYIILITVLQIEITVKIPNTNFDGQ